MDVNFYGVVRLTNLVLSYMIEDNLQKDSAKLKRKNYSIVNIGSVQSYLGIPYRGPCISFFLRLFVCSFMFILAYFLDCSSKHALLAYSDSVRGELYAHDNIQVLNVQPGYINTNVSINALTSDNQKNNMNDDDHRNG